jgi:hypothetical protein
MRFASRARRWRMSAPAERLAFVAREPNRRLAAPGAEERKLLEESHVVEGLAHEIAREEQARAIEVRCLPPSDLPGLCEEDRAGSHRVDPASTSSSRPYLVR